MRTLSNCINQMLRSLDADSAKMARIAFNNTLYKNAVKSIWKDANASRLILDHTNAFYIRNDQKPRKGVSIEEPYIICEVCADDSLVRSELDTHKELLQFALRSNGLNFEELHIIPARRGMKDRHPFKEQCKHPVLAMCKVGEDGKS